MVGMLAYNWWWCILWASVSLIHCTHHALSSCLYLHRPCASGFRHNSLMRGSWTGLGACYCMMLQTAVCLVTSVVTFIILPFLFFPFPLPILFAFLILLLVRHCSRGRFLFAFLMFRPAGRLRFGFAPAVAEFWFTAVAVFLFAFLILHLFSQVYCCGWARSMVYYLRRSYAEVWFCIRWAPNYFYFIFILRRSYAEVLFCLHRRVPSFNLIRLWPKFLFSWCGQ